MGKSPKKVPVTPAQSVPAVAVPARKPAPGPQSILQRLQVLQKAADRAGCHIESEAINRVVIALADAKHKAREARTVVGSDVAAILEELEKL